MHKTLSPKKERWLLLTLAGIQFTHLLDFMIMMPLGPQFTHIFGLTDAQFGFLVSAYTFSAGFSALAASTYLDRFDRKKLLLTLYALFALATLSCGLAPTYAALMAARILAGLFGGVLSALSQTIVGDVVPFERRGRAMGIVMSSFSASTVAGVPLGLFLATHFGWHMPFFAIAGMSVLLGLFAWKTMPALNAHLKLGQRVSAWQNIAHVLAEPNHQKAFLFSALLMFTGFTVIPFITIYMQSNVGLLTEQVPYLYLCGGAATLFTARFFGRMTDRRGKVQTFSFLATFVLVPLFAITLLPPVPLWLALVVTTAFFILMSGRMIPGMAIVTSAAQPALLGTFMALNSCVQSMAMGTAAFLGGTLIQRDAHGLVQNYWAAALCGAVASLLAIGVARHLTLYGAPLATRQDLEKTTDRPPHL